MAKTNMDKFAMSDNDEFFESSEEKEEEGSDDANEEGTDGSIETEEARDASNDDESGDASSDGGDVGGSDGEAEGSGAESEGSQDGEEESSSGDSSDEKGESEEGEEGSDDGEQEEDIFADLSDESGEGDSSSTATRSFKDLGDALEIELENDTAEEFTKKVKSKIEAAKQEVNVDEFDPEAQRLVKHLNKNGGKLGSFFSNPAITKLQSVLSMDAEEKVKKIRYSELASKGGTQEEINAQIDEELTNMTASQIMGTANQVDENANKLIASEIDKIVGESEKNVKDKQTQEKQKVKESRDNLKNYVQKQDNFLGLKLSEKAKTIISRDIETGKVDEVVDLTDAEIRFASYMIKTRGGKIKEQFAKQLGEKSREGYNKATDKHTKKLHGSKEEAAGKSSGHQQSSQGKKGYENWGDMDI